jgi:hypothetical protein
LGADVEIEIREGEKKLAKIVAVFIHTGPNPTKQASDAPARAVYVQFYVFLDDYQPTSRADREFFSHAKTSRTRARELVLCEKEVLLKGQALNCIKRTIRVVASLQELESSSSSSISSVGLPYVCRFAVDGQVYFIRALCP